MRVRLAVFGSTGRTGQAVVGQALELGYDVVAFARQPSALRLSHSRLSLVAGDVLDAATVGPALVDADAVVSTLGIGYSRAATTVYSAGTGAIIAAMVPLGLRRLVCVSTTGLQGTAQDTAQDTVAQRLVGRLLQRMLRRPYADMSAMERLVRRCELDWTIVRSARLTNAAARTRYRVAVDLRLRSAWSVSRQDLAGYLLRCIGDLSTVGRTVEIAY